MNYRLGTNGVKFSDTSQSDQFGGSPARCAWASPFFHTMTVRGLPTMLNTLSYGNGQTCSMKYKSAGLEKRALCWKCLGFQRDVTGCFARVWCSLKFPLKHDHSLLGLFQ